VRNSSRIGAAARAEPGCAALRAKVEELCTPAVHGYGTSGAGDILLERAGITVDAVCAALRDSLREAGGAEGAQTRMVVSADSKGAGLS